MGKTRSAFFLLLISTWATGSPALAAQLVPLGPDQDMYSDVFSNRPSVAAQPDGSAVIVWDDDSLSEIEGTIPYAHFAPGGGPDDADTGWESVQSPTGTPSVDAVTAGRQGFDVIWHTRQYYASDPLLFYRGHLDLKGKPVGKPVRLGGSGVAWIWQVRGNGFMAGWALPSKRGIVARRLAASGQLTGPELLLNSYPINSPTVASVVGLADASFVAVWYGIAPGRPGTPVLRARWFSSSAKPLGPDFDVNVPSLGAPSPDFKVAAAPGGGFSVAWQRGGKTYLRWYDAAGAPLGPEVRATSAKTDESPQSMAFDDEGNMVLLWETRLRLFDPRGTPLGPPINVSSDNTAEPRGGGVVWTGDSWLVAWVAGIFPYDQSYVFVRRFAKK